MTPYVIVFITIISFLLNFHASRKLSYLASRTTKSHISGDEIAENILSKHKFDHIKIRQTENSRENLYDPLIKVIQLGPDVYGKKTIYSIAVGCHEACHALKFQYFRLLFLPAAAIAKYVFIPLFLASFFFHSSFLHKTVLMLYIGLLLIKFLFEVLDEVRINRQSIKLLKLNELITEYEVTEARRLYRFFNYTYFASLPLKIVLNR